MHFATEIEEAEGSVCFPVYIESSKYNTTFRYNHSLIHTFLSSYTKTTDGYYDIKKCNKKVLRKPNLVVVKHTFIGFCKNAIECIKFVFVP